MGNVPNNLCPRYTEIYTPFTLSVILSLDPKGSEILQLNWAQIENLLKTRNSLLNNNGNLNIKFNEFPQSNF